MSRPAPRALRDVSTAVPAASLRQPAPRGVLPVLIAALVSFAALLVPVDAARADDGTAAWAVTPCDAAGVPTGETRFELPVEPGASATEHVLVTNSSTVERVFDVYAADGFNTDEGGYDLGAATVVPTDVGSWVRSAQPTVKVAPLSTAVVEFTVTVPQGATPGDHPGGIVVSPVRSQVSDDAVVVDTRIAVRLNVRVPGDVTAQLTVRDATTHYGFTAVPFGSAPLTVTYQVANTGNVKVLGVPRVRVTGPFGVQLAQVDADDTREVLPGDSFTVRTVIDGVAPALVGTATVNVSMASAPGPDTTIPEVSVSARTSFAAVPWTGLALVLVVAAGAWFLVRHLRARRRAGAELWDRVVDEARSDLEAGRAPRTAGHGVVGGAGAVAGALVLVGLLVVGAPTHAFADDPQGGAVTITVPKAPAPSVSTPPPTSPPGVSSTSRPRRTVPSSGVSAEPVPSPAPSASLPVTGGSMRPNAGAQKPPDLVWSGGGRRWGPVQWTLVSLLGAGGAGLLAWVIRLGVVGRRGAAA